MNPTLTVKHATGCYPIFVGAGLCQRNVDFFNDGLNAGSRNVLITDQTVDRIYGDSIIDSLAGHQIHRYVLPVGEQSKSFGQYELILNEMLVTGMDRKSTVIGLGGGVPGDLAGFVAATYMRGLNFVQIPTTLLAQVDSSVGGKTGINLAKAKNSVGAFWQPTAVIIDPEFLSTLDKSEFASGLAEVVKYGVIMDEDFFGYLESSVDSINKLEMPTLERVITKCCQLKAQVVQQDERETIGQRAILNYGHTFGHAIESVFGYGTYPHGHAVAMGMHAAAQLALILGQVDETFISRQKTLLASLNIPWQFPESRHEELENAMMRDKKVAAGVRTLVLPTRMGHVKLVSSVDSAQVLEAMKRACQAVE